MRRQILYSIILFSVIVSKFAIAAEFKGLGDLPGGSIDSRAWDISGDGSTIVGQSNSGKGTEAFIWNEKEGMKGIGDLPGGSFSSLARGVSADGSVVAGTGRSIHGQEAFIWNAKSGMKGLGDLPGRDFNSDAYGISANGSVVIGTSSSPDGAMAFRWSGREGIKPLGDLPGWFRKSWGHAISGDGLVLGGYSWSKKGSEAFAWTREDGMIGLGDLPGGKFASCVKAFTQNGHVLVGYSYTEKGMEAALWNTNLVMKSLGDLPGGNVQGTALDVSADGFVVVGYGESDNGKEAFIWDRRNRMRNLKTILTDLGIDMKNWTLIEATGISYDGTKIVGYGKSPQSHIEAWIAKISENELGRSPAKKSKTSKQDKPTTTDLPDNILSLVGLKNLAVSVEPLDKNAKSTGLIEKQLVTDTELKLRLVGIKVLSDKEQNQDSTKLNIKIDLNEIKPLQYAFNVCLQVKQQVSLENDSKLYAITWQTIQGGVIGKVDLSEKIRTTNKDLADIFLNDYLKANPKK